MHRRYIRPLFIALLGATLFSASCRIFKKKCETCPKVGQVKTEQAGQRS